MKIKVTIGICVKNAERTVKEAINSVIEQTYPHELMEIIVVDNGSKDKTLSVITESTSKKDIQFTLYDAEGKGLGEVRQIVVDKACGKYILWVDGDMVLPKNYVRKQVMFLEQNPYIGIIIGKLKGYKTQSLVAILEGIARSRDYRFKHRKTILPRMGTGGSIFRIKALKQIGGFNKNIIGAGEDSDVMIRIKRAGWTLFLSQTEFYHKYREKWKYAMNQQFWYGYGAHYLNHNHKGLSPWGNSPPIAFMDGLIRSLITYKKIRQKKIFFLSFYNFIKKNAWWLGFVKSHIDNYGHKTRV